MFSAAALRRELQELEGQAAAAAAARGPWPAAGEPKVCPCCCWGVPACLCPETVDVYTPKMRYGLLFGKHQRAGQEVSKEVGGFQNYPAH